jgi:hypothetical protein
MSAARDLEDFLAGLDQPEATQERTLLERIVRPNQTSEYGRRHGFAAITGAREFQRAAPIVRYADVAAEIDRTAGGEPGVLVTEPVRRFFLTSGSSAKPKTIPVTSSFIGDKSRAFGLYWAFLFGQHPDAQTGKVVGNFSDSGGSYKLPSGIPVSSEGSYWSAVSAATQQRGKSPLPKSVGAIADSAARYYAVARILAEEDVSLFMALNPSTILLLFRKMNELGDRLIDDVERGGISDRIDVGAEVRAHVAARYTGNPSRAAELRALLSCHDDDDGGGGGSNSGEETPLPTSDPPQLLAHRVWPNLKLVVSWRSPMQRPYLDLLAPHLRAVPQRDYILMASEGIIAIPHEDQRSGGLLATPIHFYEFIPEEQADRPEPDVLLAHELEAGKNYVVLLSTSAGLYRYNISDVVHVSGHKGRTPIVEFLYRTGATSSITGEKLTEDQVVATVGALAARHRLVLEGFTLLPAKDGFPRYVLLAELAARPAGETLRALPRALDAELQQRNIEYGAKRTSLRLEAPELWLVARGGYEALRQRRIAGGANDAQIKPVGLTRDARFADEFQVVERLRAG